MADIGKLISTKLGWARSGRLLTGKPADPETDRLPPGQRLVKDWPVLDLGVQPEITRAAFRLEVNGAVETPLRLDWDAFMALPQTESVSDMHCVTSWSRYDNHWQGVSSAILLDLVRPLPAARHVIFHAHDGYTTNVRRISSPSRMWCWCIPGKDRRLTGAMADRCAFSFRGFIFGNRPNG